MTISMIGLPSKMVKPNSEDEDRKRLRNREVVEQLQEEEDRPCRRQENSGENSQLPRAQRFGLDEIVRPEAAAPQFVSIILKQDYSKESQ
jgi:hypothetical protein